MRSSVSSPTKHPSLAKVCGCAMPSSLNHPGRHSAGCPSQSPTCPAPPQHPEGLSCPWRDLSLNQLYKESLETLFWCLILGGVIPAIHKAQFPIFPHYPFLPLPR